LAVGCELRNRCTPSVRWDRFPCANFQARLQPTLRWLRHLARPAFPSFPFSVSACSCVSFVLENVSGRNSRNRRRAVAQLEMDHFNDRLVPALSKGLSRNCLIHYCLRREHAERREMRCAWPGCLAAGVVRSSGGRHRAWVLVRPHSRVHPGCGRKQPSQRQCMLCQKQYDDGRYLCSGCRAAR
jgi:hypothetical protein